MAKKKVVQLFVSCPDQDGVVEVLDDLNRLYGDDFVLGRNWFNEEKAQHSATAKVICGDDKHDLKLQLKQ